MTDQPTTVTGADEPPLWGIPDEAVKAAADQLQAESPSWWQIDHDRGWAEAFARGLLEAAAPFLR